MNNLIINFFNTDFLFNQKILINNLTAIFNSDMQTIAKVIDDAVRVNMRDILISKVRQMYKNKKLKDIEVIRLLEQKLQFDLSESE